MKVNNMHKNVKTKSITKIKNENTFQNVKIKSNMKNVKPHDFNSRDPFV